MKATLNEKKTELTIVIDWDENGTPSKKKNKAKVLIPGDGKSFTHASSRGNQNVAIDGEVYSIGVNVYQPNPEYVKPTTAEEAVTA